MSGPVPGVVGGGGAGLAPDPVPSLAGALPPRVEPVPCPGVEAAGGLATGVLEGAPSPVRLGPGLMVAAAALGVAAALDLLWLATVSALACAYAAGTRPDAETGR